MYEDLDPSIAALLSDAENNFTPSRDDSEFLSNVPESKFDPLPSQKLGFSSSGAPAPKPRQDISNGGVPDVDLALKGFDKIEKFFEETPNPVFDDPSYYKTALTGEGQASQALHQLLGKYLNCTDAKDRTVYRQNMVNVYWNYLTALAPKMTNSNLPLCKRMLMRFGVVLPSLFTQEQKTFFSKSIIKNFTSEPIFYMDEWMREIAAGRLTLSATDEAPVKRSASNGADAQRIQQLKSKNNGKLQNAEALLQSKEGERAMVEQELQERVRIICDHPALIGLEPHTQNLSESQRKTFAEITERLRQLQKIDRELGNYIKEYQEAKDIERSLDIKATELPQETSSVDKEQITTEMGSIRQMAKMTVGRQGNHFPIFTREFFHCFDKSTGFRENVLRELAWIESIDPNAFCRIHKNVSNRIVPYVLLVPTYGDTGFCWEPFDRYNRVTSRGRIVIPMYPRDLKIACLTAVADLRWQVAKEKASYYWMEEGLTGQYYQWIDSQKLKGDLKTYFISDYILWMTKESEGVQKLPKEVRAIFWRFLPFPQDRKDQLKKRSRVYEELYQRDINRSMSDGY